MKLKKFTKNKKQKRIVIGSIVGILLLIGGISLYRTFALYKVEKTFDVLNGTVPPFMNGDIQLAITVDGLKKDTIPTSDKNYGVVVACDNAKGSWDKDHWQAVLGNFTGSKVKCNLYFESTLSGYIKALAKVEESIIEEEHEATDQTPKQVDYRYVGANPNNYVCLEESEKCTDDNLYRIIGVIPTQKDESGPYEDRVKLIKSTSYGKYSWGNDGELLNGEWGQMKLNTDTLNTTYWNEINSYHKYIEKAKWYLGQNNGSGDTTFSMYQLERANQMISLQYATSIVTNIGLLNRSDYHFSTSGGSTSSREDCLKLHARDWINESDCANSWLNSASSDDDNFQWTITVGSYDIDEQVNAINIQHNSSGNWSLTAKLNIKPSFYLKATVLYKSGDGTHDNPYKISITEN